MATTKEATPNSNAAVRDLDWMIVMGSLLCAKSAPTTSAPFSAPRLCASTRKVSHNEKLESDAFQAARHYHPGPGNCLLTASEQYDVVSHRRRFLPLPLAALRGGLLFMALSGVPPTGVTGEHGHNGLLFSVCL